MYCFFIQRFASMLHNEKNFIFTRIDLSFQFYIPAVHTSQVQTASSSLFVTKTISVLSNQMFIKTVIMPFTTTMVEDQILEEDMISIFRKMQSHRRVTQTLAIHIVLHQATAMATVILKHYWQAVITFMFLKLKFIISLKFHVCNLSCLRFSMLKHIIFFYVETHLA